MKYYDCQKVLSYNRPFIFVMGNRGAGKSFTFKVKAVKDFLKKKKKFIYVRRYEDDLKLTAPSYFNDLKPLFKDVQFNYKQGVFYINGEEAGYSVAVSQFLKMKSVSYPDVDLIIFDEFITESRKYIGGKDQPYLEPELCLNFYQTVARGFNRPIRDEVRFVFIANTVSIVNPYFVYYNIDKMLKEDTKFLKTDFFVLEIVTQEEVQDAIRNTKFGKFIAGTKYGSYATDNKFYLDDEEFIEETPNNCWYQCTIIYDNKKYGLWEDKQNNVFYMNEKYDSFCKIIYSMDPTSHNSSTRLISHSGNVYKNLRNAFENGQVRFSSQRAKNTLMLFLNYVK